MAPHKYNTRAAARRPKRLGSPPPRREQKQLKLRECPKVVVLRTSQGCFTHEDLEDAQAVLDNANAPKQDLLDKLLMLASLDIGCSHLEASQLSASVQQVALHQDIEVATIADRIYCKWEKLVKEKAKKMGCNLGNKEEEVTAGPTGPVFEKPEPAQALEIL